LVEEYSFEEVTVEGMIAKSVCTIILRKKLWPRIHITLFLYPVAPSSETSRVLKKVNVDGK
jgi:hypothetical protein